MKNGKLEIKEKEKRGNKTSICDIIEVRRKNEKKLL